MNRWKWSKNGGLESMADDVLGNLRRFQKASFWGFRNFLIYRTSSGFLRVFNCPVSMIGCWDVVDLAWYLPLGWYRQVNKSHFEDGEDRLLQNMLQSSWWRKCRKQYEMIKHVVVQLVHELIVWREYYGWVVMFLLYSCIFLIYLQYIFPLLLDIMFNHV